MAIKLTARDAESIEQALREAGIEQIGVSQDILPRGEGWQIGQAPKEMAAFLAKMDALGVKSMLEIGTRFGGLARFCSEVMGWDVTALDVSTPAVISGYTFVQSRSADYEPGRTWDLVFIDGDHSYEGVKADYHKYLPVADKVIALHDVLGNHGCEGVRAFFEQVQTVGWEVETCADWPLGIAWYAKPDAVQPAPKRTRKGGK